MNTSIGDIRERAGSVLDGMALHRQRVARDCLMLCDEVQRLREELEKAKTPKSTPLGSIFGGCP